MENHFFRKKGGNLHRKIKKRKLRPKEKRYLSPTKPVKKISNPWAEILAGYIKKKTEGEPRKK